ncbi:hypothetical protein ACIP93_32335 [Streptomyces sp. NPDC088745]|uniref:hypothetical protein n=1 Tax=Streptomyces sp. NPDC088745 TaxID=3365884 RepID=UPI0037FF23FC
MNSLLNAHALPTGPAREHVGPCQDVSRTRVRRWSDQRPEESLVRIAQAAFGTALALGALAFWLADR